jgi:hypothetical protein
MAQEMKCNFHTKTLDLVNKIAIGLGFNFSTIVGPNEVNSIC